MGRGRRAIRPGASLLALLLALAAGAALGQDAVRGRRLFADTGKETGKDVPACASCHSDVSALRAMLANHGVRTGESDSLTRWLQAVLDGAQPGARNAKAQFQGVLTPQDVRDLAAYIAGAKGAAIDAPATFVAAGER